MDDKFPDGMLESIANVIATDHSPTGLDLYDAVFDSPLMFPLQRRAEMAAMMRLARSVGGPDGEMD